MIKGYARAPAPLSSIFSPKIFKDSEPRSRPEEIGARGGGFTLADMVETWIELEEGDGVEVFVNGEEMEFKPSIEAAETMKKLLGLRGSIRIEHRIRAPLGAGFGTSASAAFTVITLLSRISGHGITMLEACRLTHEIELSCRTGLNSEAGLLSEGLILVLREGAPPRLRIDSIPLPPSIRLIAVAAGALETSRILGDPRRLREVEEIGDKILDRILEKPTPERFLAGARRFAFEAGFVTREVEEIFEELERLPTLGYAQNMIGNAAHALVEVKDLRLVEDRLRQVFPDHQVFSAELGHGVKVSAR